MLKQLLGDLDEAAPPFFEPPFLCDLGFNVFLGGWDLNCRASCPCTVAHPPEFVAPFAILAPCQAGKDVYASFSCCFLDAAPITIGDRVVFGPNVHLYTVKLSTDPQIRAGFLGLQSAQPITIGNDVWLGGGAIILPGVERSSGLCQKTLPCSLRTLDTHAPASLLQESMSGMAQQWRPGRW